MDGRNRTTRVDRGFVRGFALGLGMLLVILGGSLAFQAGSKHEERTTAPAAVATTSAASLSHEFEQVAKEVEHLQQARRLSRAPANSRKALARKS